MFEKQKKHYFRFLKNINNDSDEETSGDDSEDDEENQTPLSNTESSKSFIKKKNFFNVKFSSYTFKKFTFT